MYRTNDDYNLVITGEVSNLDKQYSLIEEQNLSYDFKLESVRDLIADGNMEVQSTYKKYKTFLFLLYQITGPLDVEISFYPEDGEEGYSESTEVSFVVDQDGNASFELKNEIEPDDDLDEDSEEYQNFKKAEEMARGMFEDDKSISFQIGGMDLEKFLEAVS